MHITVDPSRNLVDLATKVTRLAPEDVEGGPAARSDGTGPGRTPPGWRCLAWVRWRHAWADPSPLHRSFLIGCEAASARRRRCVWRCRGAPGDEARGERERS